MLKNCRKFKTHYTLALRATPLQQHRFLDIFFWVEGKVVRKNALRYKFFIFRDDGTKNCSTYGLKTQKLIRSFKIIERNENILSNRL